MVRASIEGSRAKKDIVEKGTLEYGVDEYVEEVPDKQDAEGLGSTRVEGV